MPDDAGARIDVDAIRAAAGGDPGRRVAVAKTCLAAIADELDALTRLRAARRREADMDHALDAIMRGAAQP